MGFFRRKPKETAPEPPFKMPDGEFELTVVGSSGRRIVDGRTAVVAKAVTDLTPGGRHRITVHLPRKRAGD